MHIARFKNQPATVSDRTFNEVLFNRYQSSFDSCPINHARSSVVGNGKPMIVTKSVFRSSHGLVEMKLRRHRTLDERMPKRNCGNGRNIDKQLFFKSPETTHKRESNPDNANGAQTPLQK